MFTFRKALIVGGFVSTLLASFVGFVPTRSVKAESEVTPTVTHTATHQMTSTQIIEPTQIGPTATQPDCWDMRWSFTVIHFTSDTTATATNTSTYCSYRVGLGAYMVFAWLDQTLVSSDVKTLEPGQTIDLVVSAPNCWTQIDLFFGEVIQANHTFPDYSGRLIDWKHLNENISCAPQTDTPQPTVTNTSVPPTNTPTTVPPTSTPSNTLTPTSTPTRACPGEECNTPTNTSTPPTATPTETPSSTPVPPEVTPLSPTDTPTEEATPVVTIPEPGFCKNVEVKDFVLAEDRKKTSEIFLLVDHTQPAVQLITWDKTLDDAWIMNPSFSPDACKIVFAAVLPGQLRADLWVMSINGYDLHRVTDTENVNELQPVWANDWSIIYAKDGLLSVTDQVYSFQRSIGVFGSNPDITPNSQWVVYRNQLGLVCVVNVHGEELGQKCFSMKTANLSFTPLGGIFAASPGRGLLSLNPGSDFPKLVNRGATDVAFDPDGSSRSLLIEHGELIYRDASGVETLVQLNLQPGQKIMQPDWWDPQPAPFNYELILSIMN